MGQTSSRPKQQWRWARLHTCSHINELECDALAFIGACVLFFVCEFRVMLISGRNSSRSGRKWRRGMLKLTLGSQTLTRCSAALTTRYLVNVNVHLCPFTAWILPPNWNFEPFPRLQSVLYYTLYNVSYSLWFCFGFTWKYFNWRSTNTQNNNKMYVTWY